MNRKQRATLAQQTIEICQTGSYTIGEQLIDITDAVEEAVKQSTLYKPMDFDTLLQQRDQAIAYAEAPYSTEFEVTNETTLSAAQRLTSNRSTSILALNFASAKNPGGGFLGGSQAQEESLARSSALYPCLIKHMVMYEYNRQFRTGLYSDHMILSPNVPVFRNDNGQLLTQPYLLSFITAPAVNAGSVRSNQPDQTSQIRPTMLARIEKILSIAFIKGYQTLVLGAWGCGVFHNDPAEVAALFSHWLSEEGLFAGRFRKIVFAVLDNQKEAVIQPFRTTFL